MPVETAFVSNFDFDMFVRYKWVDDQVDDEVDAAHGGVCPLQDRLLLRPENQCVDLYHDATVSGARAPRVSDGPYRRSGLTHLVRQHGNTVN